MNDFIKKIQNKNISSLGKAFTLIESSREADQDKSHKLLNELLKNKKQSQIIAITGAPGVGKSSFIEYLGIELIKRGKSVAVLAVDPSSSQTGGSLLGDKTRMIELSKNENAFIRPTPSQSTYGGVAKRTYEGIILCEAAGFDIVLVETVGVGQSEYEVASMVDQVYLLMQPGLGDDLQGMKRGILESANGLIIHKADSNNLQAARRTMMEYQSAMDLFFEADKAPWAHMVSSIEKTGGNDILNEIESFFKNNSSLIEGRRRKQRLDWFKRLIEQSWKDELYQKYSDQISDYNLQINDSKILITQALSLLKNNW